MVHSSYKLRKLWTVVVGNWPISGKRRLRVKYVAQNPPPSYDVVTTAKQPAPSSQITNANVPLSSPSPIAEDVSPLPGSPSSDPSASASGSSSNSLSVPRPTWGNSKHSRPN